MGNSPKIIQIIPATGWQVVYAIEGGTGYQCVDLACWGLDNFGNVIAMAADVTGYVDDASADVGFVCIKSVNDEADVIEYALKRWREDAVKRVKKRAAHVDR